MLVVHKYGGSSVATTDKILSIAQHLKNLHDKKIDLVVVVSAMGKTTNNLIQTANLLSPNPDKREMDVLMSTGELQSVSLLAIALKQIGVDSVSLSGSQAGFLTDSRHTHAFIKDVDIKRIKKHLKLGRIVIVAGFQGVDNQGDITTFGRGGSDTTATALAAKLNCPCEIYTDVDAVCTIDPNLYPNTRKLNSISYDEMMEMAVSGAKVLETRSVELAKKYNVPLYLGKTLNEDKTKGTWVMSKTDMENMPIKNISIKDDYTVFSIKVGYMHNFAIIKAIKALQGISNLEMLSLVKFNDYQIFSFGVPNNLVDEIKNRLSKLLGDEYKEMIEENLIEINQNLSRITIVGVGFSTHLDIPIKILSKLSEMGIKYDYVSNTEISLSWTMESIYKNEVIETFAKMFNL